MENKLMTTENKIEESMKKECYTSVDLSVKENQVMLYNGLTNADILLNDVVGSTIEVKDVYVEQNHKLDEETGEYKVKYRTLIFSTDGKTYATGAYGVYNSLKVIFSIFGTPDTWENPLKLKVERVTRDKKTSLNLIVV